MQGQVNVTNQVTYQISCLLTPMFLNSGWLQALRYLRLANRSLKYRRRVSHIKSDASCQKTRASIAGSTRIELVKNVDADEPRYLLSHQAITKPSPQFGSSLNLKTNLSVRWSEAFMLQMPAMAGFMPVLNCRRLPKTGI